MMFVSWYWYIEVFVVYSVLGRCLSGDCTLLSTSEYQQILLLVVKVCTATIMGIILHCVQLLQYVCNSYILVW